MFAAIVLVLIGEDITNGMLTVLIANFWWGIVLLQEEKSNDQT